MHSMRKWVHHPKPYLCSVLKSGLFQGFNRQMMMLKHTKKILTCPYIGESKPYKIFDIWDWAQFFKPERKVFPSENLESFQYHQFPRN